MRALVLLGLLVVPVGLSAAALAGTCADVVEGLTLRASRAGSASEVQQAAEAVGLAADRVAVVVTFETPAVVVWTLETREVSDHGSIESGSSSLSGAGSACSWSEGPATRSVQAVLTSAGHTLARLEIWTS